MKKTLTAAIASLCMAFAAQAADPADATLSLDNLETSYGGGPFVNANVVHQGNDGAEPTCMSPVLECDEFVLTLDFPEGIREIYPTALVRFSWSWDDPSGAGVIDFDFFVTDPDGNVVNNSGASAANPEFATMILPNGPATFHVLGVPFLALASSYTGNIIVDLGEPAEVEEGSSGEGRSLSAAGGGALGLILLPLLLLGRRRR